MTATEKELLLAQQEIKKLRDLLYQVEVKLEQDNMNEEYNGIWRDDDDVILEKVKIESSGG